MILELVLAGGCFWGVEELFRKEKGVMATEVGYTGGSVPNPNYSLVKTGTTGHAEAIRITFDGTQTNYYHLLHFFFRIHDPTTRNRQGNDVGTQYRSAIFYASDEVKKIAERVMEEVRAKKRFTGELVTQLEPFATFYPAEDYHQDYLQKNPGGYTCHFIRD